MATSLIYLYQLLALLSILQLTDAYCYSYCYGGWWSSWYIWTVIVVVVAICCGVAASLWRKRQMARAHRQTVLRVQAAQANTAPGVYPNVPAAGAPLRPHVYPMQPLPSGPGSIYFVNVNNMSGPPSYQQATAAGSPPYPVPPTTSLTGEAQEKKSSMPLPPPYAEALGHDNPAGPNPVTPSNVNPYPPQPFVAPPATPVAPPPGQL